VELDNGLLSLQNWINEAQNKRVDFLEYCLDLQARELEITPEALLKRMIKMLEVMEESIATGLSGIPSKGGLVGGNAQRLQQSIKENGTFILGDTLLTAVTYAIAVGEANAAMGRIVAAPTAGASGILPAVLFTLKDTRGVSMTELAKGLIVAGVIGMVIAARATLSGAEGGCQAECGSGAAMAAGAAVALCNGSPEAVGHAVAIALKNMLGLVCDPVAGLVEVPCVKRNAGAVSQALTAAEMALAGIKSIIPVDEVIDAMKSVGQSLHCSLKETAQGGLAVTPTGQVLAEKILRKSPSDR